MFKTYLNIKLTKDGSPNYKDHRFSVIELTASDEEMKQKDRGRFSHIRGSESVDGSFTNLEVADVS